MCKKTKNNFRFPGQYYIEETGLYYNWNRWYNNGIARYMQYDKVIEASNHKKYFSLFIYALQNPIFYVDKLGLKESCTQETPWETIVEEYVTNIRTKVNWKLDRWERVAYMECRCYWYAITQTTYITVEKHKYNRAFFICIVDCKEKREERRRKESWEVIIKERIDPVLAEKITKGFVKEGGYGGTKRGYICQCEQP